jgi:acyl carrier protein
LHNPVRVAEEWVVVDNLSYGRAGISFAAGWQSDDFVLAPQNFSDRKNLMLREIETVRRLWRGEPVSLTGVAGETVSIRTLPRPIQPELPVWLTCAGIIESFQAAGEIGANAAPPRSQVERILVDLWAEVLGVEHVGIHDDFTMLGGDSLVAVELFFKIQQRFQIELPLSCFFERPTVAAFAQELEHALASSGSAALADGAPIDNAVSSRHD